ncbi:MAG: two-component system, LytTR family, sensor kinase [Pseudothermotoga sp.]|uniref:LytS/YhcK type 5TM receptor domain-containing protein n=1 Tax=Pseudothermotoga lettingae TaxID=177758 RepID=UPI000749CD0B|nr:LytS/YhcK type 5TM receptor domain-containing protein [Pseudothermotoga lettingae]KUK21628.1 MAG: Signal transduction histidine kinase, LytS [Pseudothermotoga lettingae]MDI3494404.1 two-component system, LytTR family, sensor kinase [Pseudothermotoga sp.]
MFLAITLLSRVALLGLIVFVVIQSYSARISLAKIFNTKKPYILGLIGGIFGVAGNFLGLPYKGAIINFRDMGIIVTALYGGFPAALIGSTIASIHRYLLGGPAAFACALGTIGAGLFSSVFRKRFFHSKNKILAGSVVAIFAELIHLSIAYFFIYPPELAADIVFNALIPMTVSNFLGVGLTLTLVKQSELYVKNFSSQIFSITLRVFESAVRLLENPNMENLNLFSKDLAKILNVDKLTIKLEDEFKPERKKGECRLFIPLISRGKIIGRIVVENRDGFDEDQIFMIKQISKFVEIVVIGATAVREAILAREAMMRDFMSKLGPHFIFNTLASIRYLTVNNANDAVKMIDNLSELLRYYFKNQKAFVSLDEEIKIIECYLSIMKARYGDILSYHINVTGDFRNHPVPPMILQPVIENAVEHGEKNGKIYVKIEAEKYGDCMILKVSDSGKGLSRGFKKGVGMKLLETRLENIYSKKASVKYVNDNGLTVLIKIPLECESVNMYDKSGYSGR